MNLFEMVEILDETILKYIYRDSLTILAKGPKYKQLDHPE